MKTVDIKGCTIGADSFSGKAVSIEYPFLGQLWTPYSVIDKMVRSKSKGQDEVRLHTWWAEKEGIESDE